MRAVVPALGSGLGGASAYGDSERARSSRPRETRYVELSGLYENVIVAYDGVSISHRRMEVNVDAVFPAFIWAAVGSCVGMDPSDRRKWTMPGNVGGWACVSLGLRCADFLEDGVVHMVEVCVESAAVEEIVVGSFFCESSAVEYDDLVCVSDGGEPMCDDDGGSPL